MGYVRTLTNFAPPPRLDGQPFVQMRVEEAPTETGTWTMIAGSQVALDPVDVDPSKPQLRSFTTDQATLPSGWLRVVFIDADGDISIGDAVNAQSTGVTGLASIADVRRALGNINQARVSDADLLYYLNVTASVLESKLPEFTTPEGTSVIFNAPRAGMVWLPIPAAEVTAVRGYESNSGGPTLLSAGKWDYAVQPGGVMLLQERNAAIEDPRYFTPPVDTTSLTWPRVEIDWVNTGEIPWAVREGVAMTAAALFNTNSKLTSGMRSERIGDYSYTLSDKDVDEVMPARARKLLRPYMRRRHVFVT